jgi:group II intron reverse transcriptase/maturase
MLREKNKLKIDIMSKVTDRKNLLLALRNIKDNDGSQTPGTDGETIEKYKKMGQEDYLKLMRETLADYHPGAVRRVMIPKLSGKLRPLGIPTMLDRLVQQSILQIIGPICEAKFSTDSYGFRPNRSAQNAVAALTTHTWKGLRHIVDIDIKGFFDNVNHHKLLRQLWSIGIKDGNVIELIARMLKAEIVHPDGTTEQPTKGTPQGGILSPLLANVVLNDLDHWVNSQWRDFPSSHPYSRNDVKQKWLKKKSKLKQMYIVRYADDFKIICRTKTSAQKAFIAVQRYLRRRLKLEISEEKSGVINVKKKPTEFLGLSIKAEKKGRKYVTRSHMQAKAITKTCADIKAQARKIQHAAGPKRAQEIRKLQSIIRGKHNYYRMATMVSQDFSRIAYQVMRVIRNRLRPVTVHGNKVAKWMKERYGRDRWYINIDGNPIPPIHLVQNKPPMCFSQKKVKEKPEGSIEQETNKMLEAYSTRSIEYINSKISRYQAQKGRCFITGEFLEANELHAHHRKPEAQGGSDEYKNLVILHVDAHRLVHVTEPEMVDKYLKILNLSPKQLSKVDQLRREAGNYELMTA